jgi:hypothetical protein
VGLIAPMVGVLLAASSGLRAEGADPEPLAEWPKAFEVRSGELVLYQPQLESYEGNALNARAAVSVTPKGKDAPVFGAAWLQARLETDLDTRMVRFESLQITDSKFPDDQTEAIAELNEILQEAVANSDLTMSLDRLLASLEVVEARREAAEQLDNEPPEIIFRSTPSVLVLIDGSPKLSKLEGYELDYVVNTSFFIVQGRSDGLYYLKGGDSWYVASDIDAAWEPAERLPAAVQDVARRIEEDEKQQEQELANADFTPPEEGTDEPLPTPEVIVRTGPAELVQTDGEPEYAAIEGTDLLYLRNSESDVVLDISTQTTYVLIAGRWFATESVTDGEWSFVEPENLPESFAIIPATSDMGNVRASVPGTQEAREAVLQNEIPQTAVVDRADAELTVEYDGEPSFEPIGETDMAYAVNTSKSVLRIEGRYYCCDDAVWFVANDPKGPWEVCVDVPEQVQDIPPESPVYNVKYVYVYDSTPEVVYVGYTPGYVNSYVYGGCVVYGTGYWYRPWYARYYYPRPVTYGFSVHYNSYTGWGFSYGMSFGWLHVGVGWGRPYYGGWWGPAGYHHGYRHGYRHGYHHGYHHGYRAGAAAGYRAGRAQTYNNVYRSRNSGIRSTGTAPRPVDRSRPGTTDRPTTADRSRPAQGRPADPGPATREARPSRENNVYTDRNGDVYRRNGDQWEKRDQSQWRPDSPSPSAPSQRDRQQVDRQRLDRERQARERGDQRARQYQSQRSSPQRQPARGGGPRGGQRGRG